MKLVRQLAEIEKPFKNAVITIGNFDGVHLGHQSLFHEVIELSDRLKGTSVAMTFDPHPLRVLKSNSHPPLITLNEQKIELIEKTGIDVLICIPFTREFGSISAYEFVHDILVGTIGMKAVIVGKDYSFGNKREGNVSFLKKYAGELEYEVIVADWVENNIVRFVEDNESDLNSAFTGNIRISSTRIREMVMAGEVDKAQKLLGRNYQIRGEVVTGRNRGGKDLGFPTANINLKDELCPKNGVYAVTVEYKGLLYKGVANIGTSPTFDDNIFTIEVHILDFNENIYGKDIRVNFIKRLRDEKKFSGISELSTQIIKDIAYARDLLSI